MNRPFVLFLFSLLFVGSASAQFAEVNGTAVDLAGTKFIYGSYTISLVNTSGQQAMFLGSSNFQQIYSGTLTATGSLPANLVLPSNTAITPAGTQWLFNICANPQQIAGVFPVPPLPCFNSSQTIVSTPQTLQLIGNVTIPQVVEASSPTSLTITTPLLNNAVILGITNASGVSTMTCNIAYCGLVAGAEFDLGEGIPVATGCQGPRTVISVSGNSATFADPVCAASGGPYYGQLGQAPNTIFINNAVSTKGDGLAIEENYDGEAYFIVNHGGVAALVLDLNSTGQWSLADNQDGVAMGVGADKLTCIGGLPSELNGPCTGTGIDLSTGRGKGVFAVVRGMTTQGTGVAAHLPDFSASNISGNLGAPGYQPNGGNGAINLVTIGTTGFPSPGDYRITPYVTCSSSVPDGNLRIYIFYYDAASGVLANTYVSTTCGTGEDGTFKQVQSLMIPATFNQNSNATGYIQAYMYQSGGTGFTYNVRLVIESL